MAMTDMDLETLPESAAQARRRLDEAKDRLDAGDIATAQDLCRELLAEHTEYVEALCTLGRAYKAADNHESALPCFVRASMLSPENPQVFADLAEVYSQLGADDAAIAAAREALQYDPDRGAEVSARLVLGRLYALACEYEQAAGHLEQALDLDSNSGTAALLLGGCHMEVGAREDAAKAYRVALKNGVTPIEHAQVLYDLSQHCDAKAAAKLLKDIDALEKGTPGFSDELQDAVFKARINLGRAGAHESLGKHDDAWAALEAGNAPMRELYGDMAARARAQNEAVFERARNWSWAGPAPYFNGPDLPLSLLILGPTRAGKSTLEYLLASLPDVASGHESEIVQDSAAHAAHGAGFLPMRFPSQLPNALYGDFTKAYVEKLTKNANGAKVYTVTHPGLVTDLGRIAETVPNVKIVFVERDQDDTALRIYSKLYPEGTNHHAYDVREIYEFLEGYTALSEAWADKVPDMVMRVDYADMIADPGKVRSEVAAFCGLPVPKGKAPTPGDDRGCAEPYQDYLKSVRPSEGTWQI